MDLAVWFAAQVGRCPLLHFFGPAWEETSQAHPFLNFKKEGVRGKLSPFREWVWAIALSRQRILKLDDGTDAFTRMHQVKGLVDVFEGQFVGDEIVDIDLAIHIPVNDFWHISTSARAAKS